MADLGFFIGLDIHIHACKYCVDAGNTAVQSAFITLSRTLFSHNSSFSVNDCVHHLKCTFLNYKGRANHYFINTKVTAFHLYVDTVGMQYFSLC